MWSPVGRDERSTMFASDIIDELQQNPAGGAVMVTTTEEGCGGYGRLVVDTWSFIEARMFGWPMLDPGHGDAHNGHIRSLMQLGFTFDGTDWVWRRDFVPELVPVAAHAVERALLEVWELQAGTSAARNVAIRRLTDDELAGILDGSTCDRCLGPCTDSD